ncbi:glycosyltransferase family 4 protein [Pseudomonas shahriarae]|uniref:Glycosyltransferase family 4 protein n=1 Tax=Pseudomonas shahriarae TaxID=2745512 RepID=A0A9X4C470_9PSED|nr:glycosyltransferase family 4 protein [Pseudomonas shahriarae]MDD1009928.1 glycosyltransferase family 4 protein [Pseudomonas shahriarae]
MVFWWILPLALVLAFALTAVLRRYAVNRSMIDIPNDRSSHTVPMPRGGGVSIVISFFISLVCLWVGGWGGMPFFLGAAGCGVIVAVIGFMDDHGHIAARWRLLGHFIAAIWGVVWIGGLAPLNLFGSLVNLSWVGSALAVLYLVWMLNLYNFMDGIDGIASIEAICVCIGVSVLYWLSGHGTLIWGPALLAMAVLGFLYWNFPPAKIFMGDAGSGFLGVTLGVLSLQAAWVNPEFLWAWLILLGVFIVDATFTLLRRLLQGAKVYQAHRSHAYQYASRRCGSHMPVTLGVAAINVFWLFPLAFCVTSYGMNGMLGVLLAYTPLLWLAITFQAGEAEEVTVKR